MRKQRPRRTVPVSKSTSSRNGPLLEQEESNLMAFTEVGGSPLPGLTLRHVLRGHTGRINRIAWSQDGSYLASPSADKTIRIWDVRTGAYVRTLRGHTAEIITVAWSPDGQRIASASLDKSIRQWDVKSGNHLQTLQGHTDWVRGIAWSPDGQRLASSSDDKTIRLWEVTSGNCLKALEGHGDWVVSAAWSPDGQYLVSSSRDNTVRVWETSSGKNFHTLRGHSDWVFVAAWSPDGQLIASASADKTIRLWNTATGRMSQVLEGHAESVKGVGFSGSGRWLASISVDNTMRLWRCDTWECVAVLAGRAASESWPFGIAFHPRLPVLATPGEDATIIRIWELDEQLLLGQAQESIRYTTAKLVLVGDSGVGKTGLGWRLAHDEFKEHSSTHGQQFWPIQKLGLKRKDGTECEAVLWDLAGQHVYRQIHSIFLDNIAAALVLFDASNRQNPLKGVQFWLEQLKGKGQLPPAVLVGARSDRGAPAISRQELDQFCQHYGIGGGYISTSALTGEGLDALLTTLKAQIPWDEMTATVTTVTFKRIKDYLLALKETPDYHGLLVTPRLLREQLQATDQEWRFTDAEMMTAVGHLETHGYVAILRSSAGEQHILLTPELLVTLVSSIVLLADKHPHELGVVSETELLQGKYEFDELSALSPAESQILIDAAVVRFLQHNICFRETLGSETLLVFPGLIKQKRPAQDELSSTDDIFYVVRGRVENLYASLVVLLGYTPSFTRTNLWQNQAEYEMGEGEFCGIHLIEDREGEIELRLYYSEQMPTKGRRKFREFFEHLLDQHDAEVTCFPPVVCANDHRQKREYVMEAVHDGLLSMYCLKCGRKVDLAAFAQANSSR